MRAFIAVTLPPPIAAYLSDLQSSIKTVGADITWVKPHNIHLTLKFFREIEEKDIRSIASHAHDLLKDFPLFSLKLGAIGGFPSLAVPKIIWVGLTGGGSELTKLIGKINEAIVQGNLAAAEDKPFSAHITLGRMKTNTQMRQLSAYLARLPAPPDNMVCPVSKITFFSSTLTGSGPIYQALVEITLARA
jgi:RNA 2',3'-cyclic 3'-phosphodiesterase